MEPGPKERVFAQVQKADQGSRVIFNSFTHKGFAKYYIEGFYKSIFNSFTHKEFAKYYIAWK